MNKVCTVAEKSDWTREIVYSDERRQPSFWINNWHFVSITEEQIEEIESSTTKKVQEILKTL